MAETLCFPSFHPETLLRVTERPGKTVVRLGTFVSRLWYSRDGVVPPGFTELTTVPPDRAEVFWKRVEELDPTGITSGPSFGLDGMSIQGIYRRGHESFSFDAWSPAAESVHGRFVGLVYELAWEALRGRISIERLEQLHAYLGRGLPARVLDGDVRVLRLFGSLSSRDETALRELLASFDGEASLVFDLTNLDGMGAVFHSILAGFASGRDRLAWVLPRRSTQHLVDALRLRESQVFDTVGDALRWISSTSAPNSAS